ncbi:hypothetical protein BKA67DRAFT_587679 [Truncatella angustata]|uniref:Uncharacterized protein n=1 Tax=Truncatella angustata TaxID=152316 RepID=A0A9P8U854_9PEZI|nr:uncharacterized protein BKA67DRAFT_587679 [Truncatella angustata]KAH6643438.1 hypothetical protein BKA67DRAFT_587679 [Truncatella angustata]
MVTKNRHRVRRLETAFLFYSIPMSSGGPLGCLLCSSVMVHFVYPTDRRALFIVSLVLSLIWKPCTISTWNISAVHACCNEIINCPRNTLRISYSVHLLRRNASAKENKKGHRGALVQHPSHMYAPTRAVSRSFCF